MLKLLPLFFVALCNVSAAGAVQDVYYSGYLMPRSIIPTFDKGYLAVWSQGPKVTLYAPDGSLAYDAAVPNVNTYWNAAVDTDGTLAIAVWKIKDGGGIAVFDPSGAQLAYVETRPFLPSNVCFGPDHSIWAIGRRERKSAGDTADYFILHKYSREGKELGAFLPNSSLPGLEAQPSIGGWMMRAGSGRMGFFLSSLQTKNLEWFETDWSGKVLGHWDTAREWRPWAFTADGKLYELDRGQLAEFDRSSDKWAPAGTPPGGAGSLLGAEGDRFVFEMKKTENWVRWAPMNH